MADVLRNAALLLVLAVLGMIAAAASVLAASLGSDSDGARPGTGYGGAVASTNSEAAAAGLAALKRPGATAADAAAVMQFALNVVQPQSTGIGGGAMGLVWDAAAGAMHAIDGREEAPAALTEDAFCADPPNCTEAIPFMPERATGGHPVGVPGVVAATVRLLEEHGTLSLAEAVAPAVALARYGFTATQHLFDKVSGNVDRLARFDASAALFLNEDRSAPGFAAGDTLTNPDLADTLEQLGERGADWFYRGELAGDIVDAAAAAVLAETGLGGLLTLEDMDRYRAVERAPLNVTLADGDTVVVGHAPPTAGGVAVLACAAMLDHAHAGDLAPGSAAYILRSTDAQAIAYADRNQWVGDADWVDVPLAGLLDGDYLASRVESEMTVGRAAALPVSPGAPPGSSVLHNSSVDWSLERHGTTHLSVVDGSGNVVAWTTTIEENLGSAVAVPGRGFLLNNELTDFDALPRDADTGEPTPNRPPDGGTALRRTALGGDALTYGGKRPRSSMAPTVVLRGGRPVLALGSPGGSRIPGTVLAALEGVLAHGLSLRDAVDAPRAISRNFFPIDLEDGLFLDEELMAELEAAGLSATSDWGARPLGFVEAVYIDPTSGLLTAVADDGRLEGAAGLAF